MTNKIENTSGNKEDYIRRDFASHTQSDKYGNKATRDNAGNVILNNNKEKEEKDFSYQKKYNLISRIDSECGYYVDASILDDCFIETLIEKTKNLISSGKKMEVKYLPQEEGEEKKHEIKEKDIDIETIVSLQKIVDAYVGSKTDEENGEIVREITSSLNIEAEDINSKKICSNCNKTISHDANFCQFCGTSVELKCQKCNNIISEEANFCPKCGEKISK